MADEDSFLTYVILKHVVHCYQQFPVVKSKVKIYFRKNNNATFHENGLKSVPL